MKTMIEANLNSADSSVAICEQMQRCMGINVVRWDATTPSLPNVVKLARDADDGWAIESSESDQCNVAFAFSKNAIASWKSEPSCADSTIRHARTIVEMTSVADQRDQMQAEADALAAQVVNDFEELSLIRSLASAMEMPAGGIDLDELCTRSLVPLADGIGAISIAAVFVEDGDAESSFKNSWWSGPKVTSDDRLAELIASHREEAKRQPVVRNKINAFDHVIDDEQLSEYVLVQCRSEGRFHGWLIACNRCSELAEDTPWAQLGFTTVQASFMETATNQLAAQLHNTRLLKQKEELFTDVVRALVNAVEARDTYTCGHSERVALFARTLANRTDQSKTDCERIYLTGLLHDIGKIAIPDGVLQKPGRLDDDERAIIETHTDAGWRILHELDALRHVLPGVLYHHEHFNGKGYPDGLVGDNIPIDGRILAVCDAFDAMTSNRPYRDGMPIEKAVSILRDGAGEYWDPKLIDAFCDNIDAMDEIRINHQPRQPALRPSPCNGQPIMTAMPDSVLATGTVNQ